MFGRNYVRFRQGDSLSEKSKQVPRQVVVLSAETTQVEQFPLIGRRSV